MSEIVRSDTSVPANPNESTAKNQVERKRLGLRFKVGGTWLDRIAKDLFLEVEVVQEHEKKQD